MKKLLLVVNTVLWCQLAFAETCPKVADIQNPSFTGWQAYDSDDGTPLSQKRFTELKASVDQFALAEWSNENNSGGAIHCYYRDKNGSDLEAYFSKDNFKPDNAQNLWYEVSGYMHCAAGMDKCIFTNRIESPQQLAESK